MIYCIQHSVIFDLIITTLSCAFPVVYSRGLFYWKKLCYYPCEKCNSLMYVTEWILEHFLWNWSRVHVTKFIDKSPLFLVMAWCWWKLAITLLGVDPDVCYHMASLGNNELIKKMFLIWNFVWLMAVLSVNQKPGLNFLVSKNFLTWLLIGWQLSWQPIKRQIWKFLSTNMHFSIEFPH